MATLIQSKQIQGVITASVIQGDFTVEGAGAVDFSLASSVSGSFTGSFQGDGSSLIGISYSNLTNLPTLFSGSSQVDITQTDGFTAFSSSIATSLSTVDTDDQIVSFNSVSKVLTISEGNSVDLSSLGGGGGGGSSIWSTGSAWYYVSSDFKITGSLEATSLTGSIDYSNLTNVPSLISGSSQLTSSYDLRYALSGSGGGGGDITHLNTFTSSIQTEVDAISSTTSSYLTQTPAGTISGSEQLPSGIISSSVQILGGTGILSGSHSDVGSLNTFTSSIETRVDGISSATSSYLTSIDGGTVSGSEQITGLGFISSSDSTTSINTFTSSIQTEVDALSASTSSYLTSETDSQTLSVSGDQLTITSGNTVTIPTGSELPSGTISGSKQITDLGFISSSHSDVANLNTFTSSIQTEVDAISATTSSYLTQAPAGTISGSSQVDYDVLTGGKGLLSGSHPITELNTYTASTDLRITQLETDSGSQDQRIDSLESFTGSLDATYATDVSVTSLSSSIDSRIDSLSHSDNTSLNTFTSSIQTEVDAISSTTSSYLTSSGSVDYTDITSIPGGLISSSVQVLGGTDILSGSHPIGNLNIFTSSIQTEVDGISASTSSYLTQTPVGTISGSSQLTSSYDSRYVINQAPTATFTNNTGNFNSNLSTNGKTMVSMSVSDSESNSPFSASLGGSNGSSFDLVYSNAASSSIGIHAGSNLSAGTYTYDVSVFDTFDKSTVYSSRTITVAQADDGTLGGDTTSYIIESANINDSIRDASGFGAGNTSQLSVSYSPDYGSQAVSTYSSLNPAILVDNSGNLTIGRNLKGSGTGSGDTISSNITFTDQYNNSDTTSVTINVFANHHPSASFSDITGDMNTNEATASVDLVNVTITDTEGDTPYSASLSGTDASSFQLQYNNSNSSSVDIQSSGDLLSNEYSYTFNTFDNFGKSNSYDRSLIISQSDTGTLSTNGTFYIIESATSGNTIRLNSDGRTGTQGDLSVSYSPNYGSQVVQEFTSSNALIAVNSSGNLTVGSNISGSSETSGDTINSNITFADQYGNVGSGSISVNVTTNNAPDIVFSNSSILNTNQTTGSSGTLVTLTFSDTESDSIDYDNVSFTDSSGQLTLTQSSNTWLLTANSQLSASSYTFSASVDDIHSFRTNTEGHTISIAQSDTGSLTGDTTMYIIESTGSGAPFRDATGYENGNLAQIGVTYSPNYGSQTVQTFSSQNPAIAVDNSGNLTLGVTISGSVTQSGDTISSIITYTDQYGNVGNQSITSTVFGNASPAASFTATSNYETDNSTSGSDAGALTVSDTESDNPFVVTLAGTDGSKFDVSGTSSPFEIQPTGSLAAGTYSINITVTDSYSESITLSNQTMTVTTSAVYGTIYVYYSNYGSDAGFSSNYNGLMGADTLNSDVPPQVTAYTENTSSPYYKFKAGDIGSTSISLAGGKNATLAATISGSNLNTAISASAAAMSWASGVQSLILFPSGSDMGGIPSSMIDGFGGSTTGQYVLVEYADGTSAPLGATDSMLHSIILDSAKDGFAEWFVLGAKAQNSASTMRLKVLAVSGSLGAF